MNGQIIILHGPSSSGKSTTAVALQNAIELPFWHISIDHLRDGGVLPTKRFKNGDFNWSNLRKAFFEGFHASLAAYAHAGNNLIVEHILDNPDWLPELKELFQPFDVYFVGLHCDLEALKQREIARGDRPIGSAEQDFHSVHVDRVYDLEIRNTASTEHNVTAILEGWRSGIRKSEFATR
ncbi:Chloramphenicol 3-O phosphotransferase [Pseudovibrio sp. W64]|uniref:chloramphenicol phosphotransferase CPT family protein n=1 Tax=unclassified Pseudovibrio TaxID=2627060 RepID=UPI0007AEBEB1|nr:MULTISPECIES: AAA family ATPase [unclassified Pseudovibrio]KZK77943.1 Chloramphenicol 3-O phosphotransferase [Pseudovibrio sp. W64]KZK87596.1 Chloramphenicol 3-O phosphotransferase [Pseudovibrio sp. Ad13]KZK88755.1 Chloramphenicol 3-O phosphotransferase [Pseudovibrio sp. Ad5]KZL00293.1 Chloramphenicol 3-O phosphotransferase [Pseudovibrio sp. W74]KZL11689.1 Chloramphenicol 3-O phosphotransferase [Pseudovibrio sp. Ad14]